jgi:hypothetical protein
MEEHKEYVSKSYLPRGEVGGGGRRKDINSSPLVYPTHVKTMIIFNENFV